MERRPHRVATLPPCSRPPPRICSTPAAIQVCRACHDRRPTSLFAFDAAARMAEVRHGARRSLAAQHALAHRLPDIRAHHEQAAPTQQAGTGAADRDVRGQSTVIYQWRAPGTATSRLRGACDGALLEPCRILDFSCWSASRRTRAQRQMVGRNDTPRCSSVHLSHACPGFPIGTRNPETCYRAVLRDRLVDTSSAESRRHLD